MGYELTNKDYGVMNQPVKAMGYELTSKGYGL